MKTGNKGFLRELENGLTAHIAMSNNKPSAWARPRARAIVAGRANTRPEEVMGPWRECGNYAS